MHDTIESLAIRPMLGRPDVTELRRALWKAGYRPVAVVGPHSSLSPGKRPTGKAWQERARRDPPEAAAITASDDALNTGILCDGLRAIDCDFEDSAAILDLMVKHFGRTICRTRANSGRWLAVYAAADGKPRKRSLIAENGKLEVLGFGQQFVAFGVHASGAVLEWPEGSPLDCPNEMLIPITEDQITAFFEDVGIVTGGQVTGSSSPKASAPSRTADPADAAAAMQAIPNDGPADWERWNRIGMALFAATAGKGFHMWREWSERHPQHDSAAIEERWKHWTAVSPPSHIGAGTLFYEARQAVPGWRQPSRNTGGTEFAVPAADTDQSKLVDLSEDEVALFFAARHASEFMFDHDEGRWFKFKREHGWVEDGDGEITRSVRSFVRAAREQWGRERPEAKAAGKIAFSSAVERASRSDRRMAVTRDRWDADAYALGIPGGWVDLRTGESHVATPARLIRRQTTIAPAPPGSPAPRWLQFLEQATGGDTDQQRWLQRFMGYSITGDMQEEIVAFFYGAGGNGKGVFLHTMSAIIGDYAYQVPAELFKADSRINREYQLAKVDGKRLVLASETEAGASLAESIVKELSGNEGKINARHVYGRPFEFRSQAKLLIVGNHAPKLQGRSPAMERRLRVVPFNHKPAKPDASLKTALIDEYPAILRWIIDGCLMWQEHGLGSTKVIAAASESYFAEQDTVALWVEERCDLDLDGRELLSKLTENFVAWARARGDRTINTKALKEALARLPGCEWRKTMHGMTLFGLHLRIALTCDDNGVLRDFADT